MPLVGQRALGMCLAGLAELHHTPLKEAEAEVLSSSTATSALVLDHDLLERVLGQGGRRARHGRDPEQQAGAAGTGAGLAERQLPFEGARQQLLAVQRAFAQEVWLQDRCRVPDRELQRVAAGQPDQLGLAAPRQLQRLGGLGPGAGLREPAGAGGPRPAPAGRPAVLAQAPGTQDRHLQDDDVPHRAPLFVPVAQPQQGIGNGPTHHPALQAICGCHEIARLDGRPLELRRPLPALGALRAPPGLSRPGLAAAGAAHRAPGLGP
eukprot:CAMPEP_0168475366 /NCGR_PEP_ID=MMETSP0228-20121227/61323_1 /TAXON_ID=133427 /ORGANISM="Protoceratium reticulatum, Strain CCCM 535 (=CCMP 1889)" /LENGTH=264 /DNA_ID=CAMNT_0008491429 /DNA_START=94 /DNA_END=886 /DNA_ORIENTATION=+